MVPSSVRDGVWLFGEKHAIAGLVHGLAAVLGLFQCGYCGLLRVRSFDKPKKLGVGMVCFRQSSGGCECIHRAKRTRRRSLEGMEVESMEVTRATGPYCLQTFAAGRSEGPYCS